MLKLTALTLLLLSLLAWPLLAGASSAPGPRPITNYQSPIRNPQSPIRNPITPTTAYTQYLPLIARAKPTNSMAPLVLQPEEVPSGFSLYESGIITDFSKIQQFDPVEGYQVTYLNFAQLFSGPFIIVNDTYLFQDASGAHNYQEHVWQDLTNNPQFSFVEFPIEPLGDEAFSIQIVVDEDGTLVAMNAIYIRKGNIVTSVITGGFFPVAIDPDLVSSLARIIAARL